MPNFIVYHVTTPDEIYECCYSLLKYLDIYNLKPPADHSLIIYTNRPAMLESYGALFNSFELRDANASEGTLYQEIKKIFTELSGNVLYLQPNTYPVRELENMLAALQGGAVYLSSDGNSPPTQIKKLPVVGLNTQKHSIEQALQLKNAKSIENFIEQYADLKEFRILLKDFFRRYQEESIPNQVKLMHSIDAKQIQEQKHRFRRLPLYVRILRKMMGRGWRISAHTQKFS